jgi:hypothetical protein
VGPAKERRERSCYNGAGAEREVSGQRESALTRADKHRRLTCRNRHLHRSSYLLRRHQLYLQGQLPLLLSHHTLI